MSARTRDDPYPCRVIAGLEERVELLQEILELIRRQHTCIEQNKTGRLDRLIARREQSTRRWRKAEQALETVLDARTDTLDPAQQERLRTLLTEAESLVETIRREDELIHTAIEARKTHAAGQLGTLRRERLTLRAYAGKPTPDMTAGVDRSA